MNVNAMLSENSFLIGLESSSKKQTLEELSKLAGKELNINYRDILDCLIKREKLGSTAVGNGVAIPHATEKSIKQSKGFIAILSSGIEFNAIDDQPVDLIFLLLAPGNNGSEHLQALASVSRLLRKKEFVLKLRGCQNTESALAVISQFSQDKAA
ncbi:PTS sugar transporter subunit IIA [Pseudomonadota bacterium]|nr:PTS sugar transporter subunit IIA [Pseudomonadota bacterium]